MRSLSPSRTFTCTRTVSPDFIAGRSVVCACSTSSIAPIVSSVLQFSKYGLLFFVQISRREEIGPPFERAAHRFALPPQADLAVIPRQEHVRHGQHPFGRGRRAP